MLFLCELIDLKFSLNNNPDELLYQINCGGDFWEMVGVEVLSVGVGLFCCVVFIHVKI